MEIDTNYRYGNEGYAVHATSYALLTYIRNNDLRGAMPIIKWLHSMRNTNDGQASSQVKNTKGESFSLRPSSRPANLMNMFVWCIGPWAGRRGYCFLGRRLKNTPCLTRALLG